MARQTVRVETDPLIKATVRERFVAERTVEFLAVHRRNIGSEMALVIEPQHIRVLRVDAMKLKLRMLTGERIECLRKPLRRPRQIENVLLRWLRMSILRGDMQIHALLRSGGHHLRLIMAGRALRARDHTKRRDAAMFLVTHRTGTILDHIRFMKRVLFMTRLTFAIDCRERDALVKA